MRHITYKLKYAALAAVAVMMLAACSDFLEITPRDQVTEDNFWNEKADIDQMVAGCYLSMQTEGFINNAIVWGEARSENLYPTSMLDSIKGIIISA